VNSELTNQLDLRTPSANKPKPPNFPNKDPLGFLMPLFDAYARPARTGNLENPRFAPILSNINKLPNDILLIIAGIDILAHEQLTFVERVKKDIADRGEIAKRIEGKLYDKGFHGWLEREYNLFSRCEVVRNINNLEYPSDYLKQIRRKYMVWLLTF
jgi:acetyl esterase/lipase